MLFTSFYHALYILHHTRIDVFHILSGFNQWSLYSLLFLHMLIFSFRCHSTLRTPYTAHGAQIYTSKTRQAIITISEMQNGRFYLEHRRDQIWHTYCVISPFIKIDLHPRFVPSGMHLFKLTKILFTDSSLRITKAHLDHPRDHVNTTQLSAWRSHEECQSCFQLDIVQYFRKRNCFLLG